MLDYEGIKYRVEYSVRNSICGNEKVYDTEDEAIEFIKDNRDFWSDYYLRKETYAIIDF